MTYFISNISVGCVLLQYHAEDPHPVAFISRKLLSRENNYSTVERDLLAIIFSQIKFRSYMQGKQFMIAVDHLLLVFLSKLKGNNSRLMHFSLQPYYFRLV